jgi:hypothetical protein
MFGPETTFLFVKHSTEIYLSMITPWLRYCIPLLIELHKFFVARNTTSRTST